MTIGFSSNKKNLFSKLIKWFTKSKWSHCFIVFEKIEEDFIIIEASFHGGVKFNLLSRYQNPNHYDLELIPCRDLDIGCLLPYIGGNYGTFQILGNCISRLLGLKKNIITDDLVCSELVYIALVNNGYDQLLQNFEPNLVAPEDIYECLKSQQ